jgi:hypothetical protein
MGNRSCRHQAAAFDPEALSLESLDPNPATDPLGLD